MVGATTPIVPPRPVLDEHARGTGLASVPALAWMLGERRWCVWDWKLTGGKRPKWTKPPRIPGTPIGQRVNDASTCVSYETARGAVLAGDGEGVGWVLLDEMRLVLLDLDKCRDPVTGVIAPWALAVLTMAGGAYREITPSGTGLRIIGDSGMFLAFQGKLDMRMFLGGLDDGALVEWGGSRECVDGAAIEIFYGCARYVTVTGWLLDGGPDGGGGIEEDLGGLAMRLWEHGDAQGIIGRSRRAAGLARAEVMSDRTGPIEDIVSALGAMKNDDLHWTDWVTIGLAAHAASGGDADAYEAFRAWSEQCWKHDDVYCAEQWAKWARSPATRSGIGTLTWLAQQADPGWIRPSKRGGPEFDLVEVEEGEPGKPSAASRAGDAAGFARFSERITYVKTTRRFLDDADGEMMTEQQLMDEAARAGVPGYATRGARSVAMRLLRDPRSRARWALGFTLRPGQGVLVDEGGQPHVNLWKAPRELVDRGLDPAPWFEHMERLIPVEADRERVIDRLAFAIQNPGVKINSALVLLGAQGTGKDTALVPFWAAIGEGNWSLVAGTELGGDFNEYLMRPWLLIAEMPSFRKKSSYEELKGLITAPPDKVRINLKGVPAFSLPNVINELVTSNHIDAIAMAEDDRRIEVVQTVAAAGDEGQAYFNRLYAWFDEGGSAAVIKALRERDVSAFNPKAAPPMNAAKVAMLREAEPVGTAWARSLWSEDGPLFRRTYATLDELMEMARKGVWTGGAMVGGRSLPQQIMAALRADGWVNTGVQIVDGSGRPRVWYRGPRPEVVMAASAKVMREWLEEDRRKDGGSEF